MRTDRVATVILGAGGRDFHVFNMRFRDDPASEVVAFTATQIPGLAGRRYPAALAGPLYPEGIPIVGEAELEALAARRRVDRVVFAYSDVAHLEVMHAASRALALGADFVLYGPRATMLSARRPVVAATAVRTGCGKSQTTRHLARALARPERRVAVIRHPMAYGDLEAMRVQRFTALAATIAAAAPELVVVATPIDAARLLGIAIPCVRVRTSYHDLDTPGLAERVVALLERRVPPAPGPL